MATIRDIAAAAKVSVSTVSNVINNRHNVSEEKYSRVIKAMEEIHYSPNFLATNLRNNKPKLLAVVVPELDPVCAQIVEEIIRGISPLGYLFITEITHYSPRQERAILQKLQVMGVAGIFISTCDPDNTVFFNSLLHNHFPLIFFDNYLTDIQYTSVVFDNRRISAAAAREVLQQYGAAGKVLDGENARIVTGPLSFRNQADCFQGFLSAFSLQPAPEEIHMAVRMTPELAYMDLMNLLHRQNRMLQPPEVFFASSENIASGIKNVLDYLGADSKVVCLSSDQWSLGGNGMTMVPRDALSIGAQAAELMQRFLKAPAFFEDVFCMLPPPAPVRRETPLAVAPEPKTIRILLYDRAPARMLIKILDAFTRQTNIRVEYEMCPSSASLTQRVLELPQTRDDSADIFFFSYTWIDFFASEQYLTPMEPYLNRESAGFLDQYSPEIRALLKLDHQHIFTLPVALNTQLLFYRKDLFEDANIRRKFYREYGLELSLPKTWTDFEIISRFFTKKYNPHSPVTYGTTLHTSAQIGLVNEFYPRQWAFRGRLFSQATGKACLNSPQNVRALTNLCNVYECTPKENISTNIDRETMRILQNDIAMHYTFGAFIPNIQAGSNTVDYKNIGFHEAPANHSLLGGWVLGINAYSKHPAESYQFIKWVSEGNFAERNALLGSLIPQQSVLDSVRCQRVLPWVKNFSGGFSQSIVRESLFRADGEQLNPRLYETILDDGIERALQGEMTVEDALQYMDGKINELLR